MRGRIHNLTFLGFGNVGRALARLLLKKRDEMRDDFGIEWRVTGIASRRIGWIAQPAGIAIERYLEGATAEAIEPAPNDVREWLAAAKADVLFETTSLDPFTGQPAIDHIRAALEHGAHAITANKGPVVHGYRELSLLARSKGKCFLFESAVADCLPVFSLFRGDLPAAKLLAFRGLLNATSNVILGEMSHGHSFDDGVELAQEMGCAETDPSYDVDGWDATVKVCAIANVLMDEPLKPMDVRREGIRGVTAETIARAREEGKVIKLVASAARDETGKLVATVQPERLQPSDPFAHLEPSSLSIRYTLDVLDGLTVTAHNTDLQSTAYGLLADFINAVR